MAFALLHACYVVFLFSSTGSEIATTWLPVRLKFVVGYQDFKAGSSGQQITKFEYHCQCFNPALREFILFQIEETYPLS